MDANETELGDGPEAHVDTVVVGLGASAGGLQALKSFFGAVPADSGLAYVVVMHMAPDHDSHLVELLQSTTEIPIRQVTETVELEPDHVYVIPPNAGLAALDTRLHLTPMDKRPGDRAAIDSFLWTLADSSREHAVGVILSGSGTDGSGGIGAIKKNGGLTAAQDPDEAEYDGMPRSAVATGQVDIVLPVNELPRAILAYLDGAPSVAADSDDGPIEGLSETDRAIVPEIVMAVKGHTARDFSRYKPSVITRRVLRQSQRSGVEDLEQYLELVESDPAEAERLADEFLITVTSFFRDPDVFSHLAQHVIPRIVEGRSADDDIRVWSVGCATGEEAYSLAMLLMEETERRESAPTPRIFATDLHESVLATARGGWYPHEIEKGVASARLQRFFRKDTGGYRVLNELRELVVFAPHNVLSDPPFSRLDLILCRNLLIYLERDAYREVVEILHYSLNPGGVLVLGAAESVGTDRLFDADDKKHGIYRRRDPSSLVAHRPVFPLGTSLSQTRKQEGTADDRAPEQLHQRLLEATAPPSILVSHENEIVHFSKGAGRFHEQPEGDPTARAGRLVREELRVELEVLLFEVREEGQRRRSRPITIGVNGVERSVVMDVRPAPPPNDGFVLVLFEERDPSVSPESDDEPREHSVDDPARVAELEKELSTVLNRMQRILATHDQERQEMRAAIEEMSSGNEELRSTMEELETSKEELQSMNEELRTLDQENRQRVQELGRLSDDLQNLLTATHIAILFLDRDLRILRFTPAVTEIFSIRAVDEGRPLDDLTHRLVGADVTDLAQRALETLDVVEEEAKDAEGRWFLMRALPYRSSSGSVDGAVVTFLNVTRRRESEEARRKLAEELERRAYREADRQEERFRQLVEASAQTVWAMDKAGHVHEDSPSWRSFTGQTLEEFQGEGWTKAIHPDDREPFLEMWRDALAGEDPVAVEVRLRHEATGAWKWTELRAAPLYDSSDDVVGWIAMNIDVSQRKLAEEGRAKFASMLTVVEQEERRRFAGLLHDDLQQLLYAIQMKVDVAKKSGTDTEPQGDPLQRALDLLGDAIVKTRRLGADISPPPPVTDDSFGDSLRWLQTEMQDLHGLDVDLTDEEGVRVAPTETAVLLYQLVRELLFNTAKHSGVSRATVTVENGGDDVRITVSDEGRGFDTEALARGEGLGFGLANLRERLRLLGGHAEIDSRPGEGTRIVIVTPNFSPGP